MGKTPIRNLEQIYCFLDELSFIGLAPCYDVIDEKFTAWAVQKGKKKNHEECRKESLVLSMNHKYKTNGFVT